MRSVVRFVGLGLGFGVAFTVILALQAMFRGAWMPLLLSAVVGVAFAMHPRLGKAPASGWLVATFLFVALALWMKSSEPTPIRGFRKLSELVPSLILLLSTIPIAGFLFRNSKAQPKSYIYLPAAIAFCLLGWAIVYLSGGRGGADPMVRFFMDLFGVGESSARDMVIVVRKSIHFLAYGTIALCAFRIANPRFDLSKALLFAIGVALTFACFDEYRQHLTPNRSGSFWDIGLDLLGSSTFLAISVLRYQRKLQPDSTLERFSITHQEPQ